LRPNNRIKTPINAPRIGTDKFINCKEIVAAVVSTAEPKETGAWHRAPVQPKRIVR
jgi:hypothetical protein